MPQFFNQQRLLLPCVAFAILVIALSIVITTGNPHIDNVLFKSNVPEPASLFLLGSGLAGTAGMLRRRLRNRQVQ